MKKIILILGLLIAPSIALSLDIHTLEPVDVWGDNYHQADMNTLTTVGGRIPVLPIDSSRNVQIINEETIKDRGTQSLNQAMQNSVSGIDINANASDPNRSNFMIRGFQIDDDWGTKIDGQMELEWADFEWFDVDHMEVSKGPNAGTMGLSDPGGFVNYVTKKANWNDPLLEFTQNGGSYGYTKTNIAYTTPVNDWMASRTVATFTNGQTPWLNNGYNSTPDKMRGFFGQNFMFKLGEKSSLQFDIRNLYDSQNYGADSYLPAVGFGPAPINIRTNMASPQDFVRLNNTNVGYQFNTEVDDKVSFHHDFKYQSNSRVYKYMMPYNLVNNKILQLSYYDFNTVKQYESTDNYFTFKYDLFGLKNNLVTGFNYINSNTNTVNNSTVPLSTDTCTSTNAIWCLNIYNPSYAGFNWVTGATATATNGNSGTGGGRNDNTAQGAFSQQNAAVYAQDELYLMDNWILNTGVRYNHTYQSGTGINSPTNTKVNPNVGMVYKILPNLSVYADYAQGFMPQTQVNMGYAPPQNSYQTETGIKLIDKDYSFTASWFTLNRTNAQTTNPNAPNYVTYTGEVNTNGFELDGMYKLPWVEGLSIRGNYANLNSSITKDLDPALIGNKFPSVPKNQGGGWAMYDTVAWELPMGFGIGFMHSGQKYGDTANSFVLPAYTTMDMMGYVDLTKNAKLSLNLKNVTNEKYYAAASNRYAILQGQPFVAIANLEIKF